MTEEYKVLGQSAPIAATSTTLYSVPASTEAVTSTIVVANRSATATSFRISVALSASALTDKQYLYYDVPIEGNDTFAATIGITLATTDVVRVYATLATLSFSLFGTEVTA